ncbi:MFS transporter [Stieleria sp. TO1_6]|uniref:MDR family MFS transporter n=1 Tax=Stieleria tagensis TaxID=2956795 RepID=UPI00209A6FE9|nr:MFS transporter [Stieleria tagensis]MCO8122440.1 MFS transporter [Stieleria tagensis]
MLRDYLRLPLPVRILCLGSLVNRAGSFVVIFLAIYASEKLGFGVPFATACIGVLGVGGMLGSVIGGHLADQIGRRSVMLFALFGGAALLIVLSLVTNRWLFMLSVGAFALVADLYRPAAAAMIADLVSVDRRSHAFALMYISVNLGFAIAPPVGGLLAGYSFEWLFWIDAISMAVYGIIIVFAIAETRPSSKSLGMHRAEPEQPLWDSVGRIVRDTPFMLFCFAMLMISLVFVQGMSTLPIYVRQSGYSNFQFGLLMSVNGVLIFLLQLPLTHWLSRFQAMTVVVTGGFLIALGFGLTTFHSGIGGNGLQFAFIALCIAVWTLGEILQAPFQQAIVTEMAPDDLRGRYLGVFGMGHGLALTIGAPVGGAVLYRFGAPVLWLGALLIAAAASGLLLLIHWTVMRRIKPAPGDADDSVGLSCRDVPNPAITASSA